MRMHLNYSECSCQLLREAKWQYVHYPLIKGFYKSAASATPERRKKKKKAYLGQRGCTNPRWQSNRAASSVEISSPAAEKDTRWVWHRVRPIKHPSTETSHLVAADLVTKEHNLHIPPSKKRLLSFWDWSKFSLCCVSLHKCYRFSWGGGGWRICAHGIHLVNKGSWADLKDFERTQLHLQYSGSATFTAWIQSEYKPHNNVKKIYIYTHSSRISSQRIIKGGLLSLQAWSVKTNRTKGKWSAEEVLLKFQTQHLWTANPRTQPATN